ncbi:hypothetical protein C5615_12925 [Burkholderia cepacia]|uniref:Uncharacterized protein n=1 Tax=Burkholderia cepacia TaxID=292 RepID=A0A2S8IUH8_BURCE|nr:hypothetical protein C5615_12925 [Burkholderia cepacia]
MRVGGVMPSRRARAPMPDARHAPPADVPGLLARVRAPTLSSRAMTTMSPGAAARPSSSA